jgi:imidazolonepropionase-like amidohydrolase
MVRNGVGRALRRAWVIGMLLVAAAAPASAQSGDAMAVPRNDRTLAFVDVTVLPMDRARVLEAQTVIVVGDRITAVGPAATTAVPADALVIRGAGRWLMPGLVDMHAHVQPGVGTLADPAGRQLAMYLAHGVTTARSLAGAPSGVQLRDRVARGELLGPRLVIYSPSLNSNSVPSATAAAGIVGAHHAAGADGFKVHGGFDAETHDSIVAAARRAGLPVSGHVTPGYGLGRAVAAGQQIEHLDGFLHALLPPGWAGPQFGQIVVSPALLALIDRGRIPALAQTMAERGIWNGPTLALFELVVSDSTPEQLAARPTMRYVPPQTVEAWSNQLRQQQANPAPAEGRAAFVEIRREIVRALHAAGARLLAGSDSPQFFMTVGDALHRELEALVAAGLPPFAALEAATRNPAEFLRDADPVGTIAPGMRADLLLLDASPLADISNIRRVAGVAVGGRWLDGARLDAIRAAVAGSFD